MKPQPHDMVHVEIFLGGETSEETISARKKDGVVSINDSYKFISENYFDIKYHFKSIDNWLNGNIRYYNRIKIIFFFSLIV